LTLLLFAAALLLSSPPAAEAVVIKGRAPKLYSPLSIEKTTDDSVDAAGFNLHTKKQGAKGESADHHYNTKFVNGLTPAKPCRPRCATEDEDSNQAWVVFAHTDESIPGVLTSLYSANRFAECKRDRVAFVGPRMTGKGRAMLKRNGVKLVAIPDRIDLRCGVNLKTGKRRKDAFNLDKRKSCSVATGNRWHDIFFAFMTPGYCRVVVTESDFWFFGDTGYAFDQPTITAFAPRFGPPEPLPDGGAQGYPYVGMMSIQPSVEYFDAIVETLEDARVRRAIRNTGWSPQELFPAVHGHIAPPPSSKKPAEEGGGQHAEPQGRHGLWSQFPQRICHGAKGGGIKSLMNSAAAYLAGKSDEDVRGMSTAVVGVHKNGPNKPWRMEGGMKKGLGLPGKVAHMKAWWFLYKDATTTNKGE